MKKKKHPLGAYRPPPPVSLRPLPTTQESQPEGQLAYQPIYPRQASKRRSRKRRNRNLRNGCLFMLAPALAICLLASAYFFFPSRTNILLLGIDYAVPGSWASRSDTNVMSTFLPHKPYVGLLSVPRDLWVDIPGFGQNRINTAHFFYEAQQPGSGPFGAMQTFDQNFGVDVDYYARIRFEGFREVVNALGGVTIELSEPMAGYPPGVYHLTGNKALAFVRDRNGTDDFFRMRQGQFMLKAVMKDILKLKNWVRFPIVFRAISNNIQTNVPIWLWPRFAMALLRVGPSDIDSRTITREMVQPFTTDQGAYVLLPKWELINPLLFEIFGQ